MYSALCANDCTLSSEEGILIRKIKSNKQEHFIAPGTRVISDDEGVVLTECFNDAPIGLVAFGGIMKKIHDLKKELDTNITNLQNQLAQLEVDLNVKIGDLSDSTQQSISELTEALAALESNINATISGIQTSVSSIQTSISNLQTSITNINASIAALSAIQVTPDWANAVWLGDPVSSYTATRSGWICGSIYSSGDGYVLINGIYIAHALNDNTACFQVLVSSGDVMTTTNTMSTIYFVPTK